MTSIGIDFGLREIRAAYSADGVAAALIGTPDGLNATSSLVVRDGDRVLAGRAAISLLASNPRAAPDAVDQVRDLLGGPSASPSAVELAAALLGAVKQDAETALGERVDAAAITVPAYFTDRQRVALGTAASSAGFQTVSSINEPVAIARVYNVPCKQDGSENILVYDFGESGFDCAVLSSAGGGLEILATGGDAHLGGRSLDLQITDAAIATVETTGGWEGARLRSDPEFVRRLLEMAKEARSLLESGVLAAIRLPGVLDGRRDIDVVIDPREYEGWFHPDVDRSIESVHGLLHVVGLSPGDVSRILLAGDWAATGCVRRRLAAEFPGAAIPEHAEPAACRALGAALLARRDASHAGLAGARGQGGFPAGGAAARARFQAVCLLNAGRPEDAEERLRAAAGGDADPALAWLYGVALARLGRHADAAQAFAALAEGGADPAAKSMAVGLLQWRAGDSIRRADWGAAAEVAALAIKLAPADPVSRKLLAAVEGLLPAACIQSGRRQEAAAAWEQMQKNNPADGRVAHSLALLYSFWAGATEREGDGRADSLWERAMANWTLARYSDAFWRDWAAERQDVYAISPAALAHLRETWSAEFLKRFRESAGDSLGSSAPKSGRRRKLEVRYWLEQACASAVYELSKVECPHCRRLTAVASPGPAVCGEEGCGQPLPGLQPAHDVAPCGPLALAGLGLDPQAAALAQRASSLPNGGRLSGFAAGLRLPFLKTNAELLQLCLSPWNYAFALMGHQRYDEAVDRLGGLAAAPDELGQKLLLCACLEHGRRLASQAPALPAAPDAQAVKAYLEPKSAALRCWQAGLKYQSADPDLAKQIAERVEAIGVGAANELKAASEPFMREKKWIDEIRVLGSAIDFLKQARQAAPRERIVDTLAALYIDRALSHTQMDPSTAGLDKQIADCEEAQKLRPNASNATEKLAQALNNRGCKTYGHAAIPYFDRAIRLNSRVALFWSNRAVSHWDHGSRSQAKSDIEKARQLDPGNATIVRLWLQMR